MKEFATLIYGLDSTNKVSHKQTHIHRFFDEASELDKLWMLALFMGKKPKRSVKTTLLRSWALEITQLPEWLFLESYASVGDLGETLSLILPEPEYTLELPLHEWMNKIISLKDQSDEEKKKFVLYAWRGLTHIERFIFNKLLGGSFRVGVSAKGFINALSSYYQIDPNTLAHSLMGDWALEEVTFDSLIKGEYTNTSLSKPYPFCLAYAIEEIEETLIDLNNWQIEYKWDGIRGQIIKRKGEIFIWSRGEELITDQFPDLVNLIGQIPGDFVIDGEILAVNENLEIQDFSALQKRLNRKNITKSLLDEVPANLYVYDLIELNLQDLRQEPLRKRRELLEELFKSIDIKGIKLSPVLNVQDFESLKRLREEAREINSEGLMIKKKDSIYHVGRKKGDWWKWKVDPLTLDAVLIYAQKGSGRRSGYYTDYTFAVKDGEKLTTIAKAYSGLTDKEIQEVSRFVNKNAIEKFGPVRTVKPELVFEIAFEGISFSNRHKSGVALRFPRIHRWRKDKKMDEIDTLDEIKKLIKSS